MQNVTMANNQHFTATCYPVDASGNPGTITFPPAWSATPAGLTLTPSTDGMTCLIASGAATGTFTVTVSAQGVPESTPFTSEFTVTIAENAATQFAPFTFTSPVNN